MLTISIKIFTLPYEDFTSTDITEILRAYGNITQRSENEVVLEYDFRNHAAVRETLSAADDWVQGVELCSAEAEYGFGSSRVCAEHVTRPIGVRS